MEEFLDEVCKKIKYKKACAEISDELRDHIYDHAYSLMENGVSKEVALVKAVEAMGDAEELGINLNKLHKPFLGWLLNITNVLVVLFVICLATSIIPSVFGLFENFDLPKSKDVKYYMNLNEKDNIDDRTVIMKKVEVDKSNDVYIRYDEYSKPFFHGWSMLNFDIYDDLGNKYNWGSVGGGNIFVSRTQICITNINVKAQKIILDYDHYNRKMKFEIPITEGDGA